MKKTISKYEFVKEFDEYNRGNNFSYEGREALFDYLEEYEESTGEEMELDVIGLCCDFTEYESLEEFNSNHNYECETIDDIGYYTQVIDIDGTRFIIQDF